MQDAPASNPMQRVEMGGGVAPKFDPVTGAPLNAAAVKLHGGQ